MTGTDRYSLVLIVEPDEETLGEMLRASRGAGYHSAGVTTFEEARRQIKLDPPSVLVTNARLGPRNGVHLAHLAHHARPDCHSLILADAPDPILDRDAAEASAVIAVRPFTAEMLPAATRALFGTEPCQSSDQSARAEESVIEERRIGERRKTTTPDYTPERRQADRRQALHLTPP